jgi:hypothetical protein
VRETFRCAPVRYSTNFIVTSHFVGEVSVSGPMEVP